MNIEAYIASGILELYVAGLLTEEEVKEVQRISEEHPEVGTEIRQIEEALESYAEHTTDSIPQSDILKGVMQKLEEDSPRKLQTNGLHEPPVIEAPKSIKSSTRVPKNTRPPKDNGEELQDSDLSPEEEEFFFGEKLTPSQGPEKSFLSRNFYPIAATILLLASMVLNFFLYQRHENLSKVVSTLMREYHELKADTRQKDVRLAVYEDKTYKRALMAGTERAEDASATVYWSAESNEVFIKIHSIPTPAEGLQYQLWALQDGVPVNAGILASNNELQKVLSISGEAQAFAITLEPRGGRETPTLEQLYLQGSVGS